MMKHIKRLSLALLLSSTFASGVAAQGIPVIDNTSIAQLILQLNNQATQIANQASQIENQVRQITQLQDQLTNMQQRLQAITGPKNISSILNGTAQQTQRQAATSLTSIFDSAIGGGNIQGSNVDRLSSTISNMRTRFNLDNLSDFDGSDVPQDRALASVAGAGLAATATGEDAYIRSNEGTERVNTLIDQIDETADLKSSIDLNTRVLAELSQQMNELIRIQATLAANQGTLALAQARDRAAARTFGRVGE